MQTNGVTPNALQRTATSRYKLPKLPSSFSESLTAGTSIPPPQPPTPPPKDASPALDGKIFHLSQRPTSPTPDHLTSANSMPGAFPSSPMAGPSPEPQTPTARPRTTDYISSVSSSPYVPPSLAPTTSPRRSSKFLSLKTLSRFYSNNASPNSTTHDSAGLRPDSPGVSSTTSTARPSLKHKKSGSFWNRRKSSLALGDFESQEQGQNGFLSPSGLRGRDAVVEEEVERTEPELGEADVRPRLNKKKSGTFWKRRSSFALPLDQPSLSNGRGSGSDTAVEDDVERHGSVSDYQEYERPRTPPPMLPELGKILEGGMLGDGEDMFKDIH